MLGQAESLRLRQHMPVREPAPALESDGSNTGAAGCVERRMGGNRIDKHERPKGQVAEQLRAMGLEVDEDVTAGSYDLLVNGQVRITLRVAYPGLRRHRVTVGGRSYRYRYETWHFNFHHHGRLDERYTDFFVCIAVDPKDPARNQVFVIPWESVSGKTFSLHSGRGTYRGRYAPYLEAWEGVARGSRLRPLRRVA